MLRTIYIYIYKCVSRRVNKVNKLDPGVVSYFKTVEAGDRNKRVGKLAFHKGRDKTCSRILISYIHICLPLATAVYQISKHMKNRYNILFRNMIYHLSIIFTFFFILSIKNESYLDKYISYEHRN